MRELKERWEIENGMAVGEVRLMAEGRVLGWDGLANLADGTIAQASGNICGGMGKKPRKKKEKNPWESDGSGVPSWAQEVPWSDGSSAEEQFEAIEKDELMEQFEKDLESGAVDTLSKMETKQAQDMLTKLEENMAGISEEKRKMAVWSLMWMAEKKKEELREKEERGKAEEREKMLEEESEKRESQSKNSETASENLMDDRSRKWEDRRRLEREGNEIIKVLVKHEEKEAAERREKKEEERWARWEEKRERRTEERWANWEDRQRLERQGDEMVEMIRRHEEEEEEKRRRNEGMSAGDECRMMLRMAENHVLEASKHREMFEEKAQKGIREAREKVAIEMGEMIEKGYGNVTFGSEEIRPGEFFERKKGELARSEVERGQAAEDRVLSRHLAEANRDEEERRIQGKGKGRNMVEDKKGGEIARCMGEKTGSSSHDVTPLKEMIVAAAVEEIDREETMTQATVAEMMIVAVSDGVMTKTTDEVAGVRNDEHMLLEQLLQGNEMEGNGEERKHVEEKHERNEMQDEIMQSKAKAVADCGVQTQEREMVEVGKEGSIMSHEKSALEVGQPYFVVSKQEEKSGGC